MKHIYLRGLFLFSTALIILVLPNQSVKASTSRNLVSDPSVISVQDVKDYVDDSLPTEKNTILNFLTNFAILKFYINMHK